ncbi:ABC transporter substrate-binding protein [candidate division CSSED10-310 bacterium]|uniref:ABC transporter substrate-binding protein n=1 Tax=candidate division CSSED10-310 bacterium TaxID=2855610 RepID=A0ABV6YY99_UNCC1
MSNILTPLYSRNQKRIKGRLVIFSGLMLRVMVVFHCSQKEERTAITRAERTADTSAAPEKKTLVRELASDPQNLNPVLLNDYTSYQVLRNIFDPLLDIDGSKDSNLVGRLAQRWDISVDRLSITFFLRPGITWHDGRPFTAEDVEFTFNMAQRADIPALLLKSTVEPLEDVEILDSHTIKFCFRYPFSPGLSQIGRVFIIPKHRLDINGLALENTTRGLSKPVTILNTAFNRNPLGTGPYVFEEWKTGQHIKLSMNQDYWDKAHVAKVPEVIFKIIPNRIVAFNMLQKEDLDVLRAETIHYLRFQRMGTMGQKYVATKFLQPYIFTSAGTCVPSGNFS